MSMPIRNRESLGGVAVAPMKQTASVTGHVSNPYSWTFDRPTGGLLLTLGQVKLAPAQGAMFNALSTHATGQR